MKILCPHFNVCSGCVLETDIEHPKTLEEATHFFSTHGVQKIHLQTGAPEGWRCRARLAVRGSSKEPLIGLFKEGTHDVVEIPSCKIHHPLINQAVLSIRKWIIEEGISLYDEATGKGLLRYLQLTVSRESQNIQLVLVVNSKEINGVDQPALERLGCSSPGLWHSIWLNFNTRRDNPIFGRNWQLFCGEQWCKETIKGKMVCYHPESFMQANPEMFERLLISVERHIPENASILEFYAGVGAIGLSLVDRCSRILCVELVQAGNACFEASKKFLSENVRERISFKTSSAAAEITLLEESADIVIVDPPRKGVETKFMKELCEAKNIKKIIYISCGWDSFKRDCELLLNASWKLESAELFLFFPGSEHLEILAVFESENN